MADKTFQPSPAKQSEAGPSYGGNLRLIRPMADKTFKSRGARHSFSHHESHLPVAQRTLSCFRNCENMKLSGATSRRLLGKNGALAISVHNETAGKDNLRRRFVCGQSR